MSRNLRKAISIQPSRSSSDVQKQRKHYPISYLALVALTFPPQPTLRSKAKQDQQGRSNMSRIVNKKPRTISQAPALHNNN